MIYPVLPLLYKQTALFWVAILFSFFNTPSRILSSYIQDPLQKIASLLGGVCVFCMINPFLGG